MENTREKSGYLRADLHISITYNQTYHHVYSFLSIYFALPNINVNQKSKITSVKQHKMHMIMHFTNKDITK